MILLDTSAIYALASSEDANHASARQRLERLDEEGEVLLLHTYVLLESFSLLHRRLGLPAATAATEATSHLPLVVVDREQHDRGVRYLRKNSRRSSSLVDAISFLVMADRGIRHAFAFDEDFERAGFHLYGA